LTGVLGGDRIGSLTARTESYKKKKGWSAAQCPWGGGKTGGRVGWSKGRAREQCLRTAKSNCRSSQQKPGEGDRPALRRGKGEEGKKNLPAGNWQKKRYYKPRAWQMKTTTSSCKRTSRQISLGRGNQDGSDQIQRGKGKPVPCL